MSFASGVGAVILGVASLGLASFGILCAVLVPVGGIVEMRRRVLKAEAGGVSTCPLIGSVAGSLAVLVAPFGTLRSRVVWSWAPLAIEVSVLLLLGLLWKVSGLAREAEANSARRH